MIHLPTEGPPKTSRIRYDALMTWSLFFYFTAYSQMFAALSASIQILIIDLFADYKRQTSCINHGKHRRNLQVLEITLNIIKFPKNFIFFSEHREKFENFIKLHKRNKNSLYQDLSNNVKLIEDGRSLLGTFPLILGCASVSSLFCRTGLLPLPRESENSSVEELGLGGCAGQLLDLGRARGFGHRYKLQSKLLLRRPQHSLNQREDNYSYHNDNQKYFWGNYYWNSQFRSRLNGLTLNISSCRESNLGLVDQKFDLYCQYSFITDAHCLLSLICYAWYQTLSAFSKFLNLFNSRIPCFQVYSNSPIIFA